MPPLPPTLLLLESTCLLPKPRRRLLPPLPSTSSITIFLLASNATHACMAAFRPQALLPFPCTLFNMPDAPLISTLAQAWDHSALCRLPHTGSEEEEEEEEEGRMAVTIHHLPQPASCRLPPPFNPVGPPPRHDTWRIRPRNAWAGLSSLYSTRMLWPCAHFWAAAYSRRDLLNDSHPSGAEDTSGACTSASDSWRALHLPNLQISGRLVTSVEQHGRNKHYFHRYAGAVPMRTTVTSDSVPISSGAPSRGGGAVGRRRRLK